MLISEIFEKIIYFFSTEFKGFSLLEVEEIRFRGINYLELPKSGLILLALFKLSNAVNKQYDVLCSSRVSYFLFLVTVSHFFSKFYFLLVL